MPADITIRCPLCNTRLVCTPFSWITPEVVGVWVVPDHPAESLGNTWDAVPANSTGYEPLKVTLRCPGAGAYVERGA